MRKMFLSSLALTVLLGLASLCHADSAAKPLVTVSFAGYDKLVADIGTIGKLGGNPNLGKQLEMMALMLPQGEGSKGPLSLDTKQPWGAVVFGGKDTQYYAFLPANDIKPMMELAKAQSGRDIKSEKGIYEVPIGEKTMYATQKGDWAYIADSKETLAKVDKDPAALLGDLPKKYNLAFRASVKNMPKEYREQLLAQLRAGMESGMQQTAGEDAEAYAVRLNVAKQGIQQLTTMVNDLEDVLLGWNIDAKSKSTYLDVEFIAQSGSKLAEQFAEIKLGKTKFAGLMLPNAAVTVGATGTFTDEKVAQAKSNLASVRKTIAKELQNQGLGEEDLKLAKQLLGDVISVLEKTIESKKTDAGMSIILDPAAVTLVAGATIVDGDKLEKVYKKVAEEVKKSGDVVKMTDESYQGVKLHVISIPTPDQSLAPMVGDTLDIVVGIAGDKAYLAAGRDAVKTLKKALKPAKSAAADKEVPPFQVALSVKPIEKFLAEVAPEEQVKSSAEMLAGLLDKVKEKDRITITSSPVSNGVRVRLEIEEGLLKVIGSLSQTLGGVPAGGGGF